MLHGILTCIVTSTEAAQGRKTDKQLMYLTLIAVSLQQTTIGLQAVLAAVNHNIPAADLLLRDMEQHQAPSGSDSDEDSANHIVPPQTLASPPADESRTLGKQYPGAASTPETLKAPAPPTSGVSTRTSFSRGRKQSSKEEDADVDLYYKYRGEALKLSRRWHKKLHQSATAFAAANFSGACSHFHSPKYLLCCVTGMPTLPLCLCMLTPSNHPEGVVGEISHKFSMHSTLFWQNAVHHT